MKRKYKITLVIISILLFFSAVFGIGYGVWVNTRDEYNVEVKNLACFEIYIDSTDVYMQNISSVISEEGKQSSPFSLTVTNVCTSEKDLQIRLAILENTTVDIKSLMVDATGNVNIDEKFYMDLDDAKSNLDNIKYNKLLSKISIKPRETIRANIKLWFDERKNPIIGKDDVLVAKFELIDGNTKLSIPLKDKIIATYEQKDNLSFLEPATTNEGLISVTNSTGTYYYYRGDIKNNYISFADQIWRIVGVNADGTVKMILNGSAGENKFGDNTDYKDYVGLTYDHSGIIVNNSILRYLTTWYQANITDKGLDSLVAEEEFCNDTSFTITNNHVIYGGYNRIVTATNPSTLCPERSSDFGGKYQHKIGLITADEAIFAGGLYGADNETYYLNMGVDYYTYTPSDYVYNNPKIITITSTGAIGTSIGSQQLAIRPVINLVSSVEVTGAGTETNPYLVDMKK